MVSCCLFIFDYLVAVHYEHTDICKQLIANGAYVDATDYEYCVTPLHSGDCSFNNL